MKAYRILLFGKSDGNYQFICVFGYCIKTIVDKKSNHKYYQKTRFKNIKNMIYISKYVLNKV